jgi:diguanylate cyclase (GGDEF)-like protein
MVTESLTTRLTTLLRNVESRLIPEHAFSEEFELALEGLKKGGICAAIEIHSISGRALAQLGVIPSEYFVKETESLGQFDHVLHASYFREAPGFDQGIAKKTLDEVRQLLVQIAKLYWGTRDGLTFLYRQTESHNLQRLNNALAGWASSGTPLAVLHIDLDHFKRVNSDFSENVGNDVLAEFGQRIREAFGDSGLLIRKGGEEFSVFLPGMLLSGALTKANQFRRAMEVEPFHAISRPNPCSIGVAYFSAERYATRAANESWFDFLLAPALNAESRAKLAGRNCLTFESVKPVGSTFPHLSIESAVDIAIIAARMSVSAGAASVRPCNAVISALTEFQGQLLSESGLADVRSIEVEARRAFGIILDSSAPAVVVDDNRPIAVIHAVICLGSLLAALLRCAFRGTGPLPPEMVLDVEFCSGGTLSGRTLALVGHIGAEKQCLAEWPDIDSEECFVTPVGRPWVDAAMNGVGGISRVQRGEISPVVLVSIGTIKLPDLIRRCAAGVVEIDDRPITGGGLPDFWQSNISRILVLVVDNPNVAHVLVVGDAGKAPRTMSLLLAASTWDLAAMTRRLSLDVTAIEVFRRRSIAIGQVVEPNELLIRAIREAYSTEESADLVVDAQRAGRRRLAVTIEQQPLSLADGLRCSTAADSYPRIISVLRSISSPQFSDHLGRKFVEATSFKLVLEHPFQEVIPDYWQDDEGELKDYYDREFGPSGLFGKRLYSWGCSGTDQVASAARDVVRAMKDSVATRRILLTIADCAGDLSSPLGLTAIHILPRLVDGRWQLSFSYTWRTVEALVGFPFSLYGSIRFSSMFLEIVNDSLRSAPMAYAGMGFLTYTALSLHMFLDEGDQHIARAIVTGAM